MNSVKHWFGAAEATQWNERTIEQPGIVSLNWLTSPLVKSESMADKVPASGAVARLKTGDEVDAGVAEAMLAVLHSPRSTRSPEPTAVVQPTVASATTQPPPRARSVPITTAPWAAARSTPAPQPPANRPSTSRVAPPSATQAPASPAAAAPTGSTADGTHYIQLRFKTQKINNICRPDVSQLEASGLNRDAVDAALASGSKIMAVLSDMQGKQYRGCAEVTAVQQHPRYPTASILTVQWVAFGVVPWDMVQLPQAQAAAKLASGSEVSSTVGEHLISLISTGTDHAPASVPPPTQRPAQQTGARSSPTQPAAGASSAASPHTVQRAATRAARQQQPVVNEVSVLVCCTLPVRRMLRWFHCGACIHQRELPHLTKLRLCRQGKA